MRTVSTISVKVGPVHRGLYHTILERGGKELLHGALRYLLTRCRLSEISPDQVRSAAAGKPDSMLRVTIPIGLRDKLRVTSATLGIHESEMFRASIVLIDQYEERLTKEAAYRKEIGADPSYLSDAFLDLWWGHREHGLSGTDAALRLTTPLYQELADLRAEMSTIRLAGNVRKSVPSAEEVRRMSLPVLRALVVDACPLPEKVRVQAARRMVLRHFGY